MTTRVRDSATPRLASRLPPLLPRRRLRVVFDPYELRQRLCLATEPKPSADSAYQHLLHPPRAGARLLFKQATRLPFNLARAILNSVTPWRPMVGTRRMASPRRGSTPRTLVSRLRRRSNRHRPLTHLRSGKPQQQRSRARGRSSPRESMTAAAPGRCPANEPEAIGRLRFNEVLVENALVHDRSGQLRDNDDPATRRSPF